MPSAKCSCIGNFFSIFDMAKDRRWTRVILVGRRGSLALLPSSPQLRIAVVISFPFVFCLLLICGTSGDGVVVGGSCSEAKLCCSGRDSSCVVQKTWIKRVTEQDVNEKPCYCDHACLKLGDCCVDFRKTCKVADCLVSVWRNWSACDANCGTGMMHRTRTIIKHPANGGRHCPPLIQRRACLGTSCPQNPSSALKEIAMLLPVSATAITAALSNRATSEFHIGKPNSNESYDDIDAQGLFLLENQVEAPSNRYCVRFKVVKAAKACKNEVTFSILDEGEEVCVQCDGEAMRPSLGYRCAGHGTTDRSTSWSALSAPYCHGKWIRMDASSSSAGSRIVNAAIYKSETTHWSASAATTTCLRLCAEGPRFVFV